MDVVSHSNAGLAWRTDGGNGWYVGGTKPGRDGRMLGNAETLPECKVNTLMTQPSVVQLWVPSSRNCDLTGVRDFLSAGPLTRV